MLPNGPYLDRQSRGPFSLSRSSALFASRQERSRKINPKRDLGACERRIKSRKRMS